jgi:hypothetical protein
MPVVLDSNAQHLEGVHPNARTLDALLALEDHVDGPGQQANEGIAL